MFADVLKKKPEKTEIMMHMDYDKKNKVFYTNLYFPECKYVLKNPIASVNGNLSYDEIKIEKFDLIKFSYLFYY